MRGLRATGFAGANVTIPHKQAVIAFCDDLDEIARAAGSVNTLLFSEEGVLGASTDGDAVTGQIDAAVAGPSCSAPGELTCRRRGARARGRGGDGASRRQPGWPPSAAGSTSSSTRRR